MAKNSYKSIIDFRKDIENIEKNDFEKSYIEAINNDKSNDYKDIIPTPRELIDLIFIIFLKYSTKNAYNTILDPFAGTGGFLIKASEYFSSSISVSEYYGFEKNEKLKDLNQKYFSNNFGGDIDKINKNFKYSEFKSKKKFDLIFTNPPSQIDAETIKNIIENNLDDNGFLIILLQDEKLKKFDFKDLNKKIDPKIVVKLPSGLFQKASGISTNIVLIQKKEYLGHTLFVNFGNENKKFLQKTDKRDELMIFIDINYQNKDGKYIKNISQNEFIITDWKELNSGLNYKIETSNSKDITSTYKIIEKSLFAGLGQLRSLNYLLEQNNILSLQNNILTFSYKKITDIIVEIQESPQKIQSAKLYEILTALTVSNFLILSGPSGVGKTSIVEKISNAIGGNFKKMPIKSNFTDESGLLGYWNPLLSRYEGTEILDHIFESSKNKDIPYFLLLDEMNLSRIENYFSEFLACIDDIKTKGAEIKLFDVLIDNENKFKNIKYFIKKYDLTSQEILVKNGSFADILNKNYDEIGNLQIEVKIKLSSNLHIIGTINEDETTNSISNKVLDRAFYISLGVDDLFDEKDDGFLKKIKDENFTDITSKNILNLEDSKAEISKEDQDFINEINKLIQEINKNDAIGYRSIQDIATFMQNYKQNLNIFDEKKTLDLVLCQKVWPKIKNYSIIGEKETKFNDLKKKVGEYLGNDSESYKFLESLNLF